MLDSYVEIDLDKIGANARAITQNTATTNILLPFSRVTVTVTVWKWQMKCTKTALTICRVLS